MDNGLTIGSKKLHSDTQNDRSNGEFAVW